MLVTLGPWELLEYVGLPREQKISVKKCWVRESEIGEECRQFWAWNLGVNFMWRPEALENQGRKILTKYSPSKFAEEIAGNFPKTRQAKIKVHPKSALQNLGLNVSRFGTEKKPWQPETWQDSEWIFSPFFSTEGVVKFFVKSAECHIFRDWLGVGIRNFHKMSRQKKVCKTENFTKISPCWKVALMIVWIPLSPPRFPRDLDYFRRFGWIHSQMGVQQVGA